MAEAVAEAGVGMDDVGMEEHMAEVIIVDGAGVVMGVRAYRAPTEFSVQAERIAPQAKKMPNAKTSSVQEPIPYDHDLPKDAPMSEPPKSMMRMLSDKCDALDIFEKLEKRADDEPSDMD